MMNHSGDNKGTPYFWKLLVVCGEGYNYIMSTGQFRNEVLRKGPHNLKSRLQKKLSILEALKSKGVWLLDTAIFGWYIAQKQEYTTSKVSGDIQRKPKSCPPKNLKDIVLVLSWELSMKHLIRQVAVEGHLKVLVPIGCELADVITNARLVDTIGICDNAIMSETMPAPNAFVKGGYDIFHWKIPNIIIENVEEII